MDAINALFRYESPVADSQQALPTLLVSLGAYGGQVSRLLTEQLAGLAHKAALIDILHFDLQPSAALDDAQQYCPGFACQDAEQLLAAIARHPRQAWDFPLERGYIEQFYATAGSVPEQVRAIARVHFLQYSAALQQHLAEKIRRLGSAAAIAGTPLRVVLCASSAEALGSAILLDLARLIADELAAQRQPGQIELYLGLPEHTDSAGQANAFATFMEMEHSSRHATPEQGSISLFRELFLLGAHCAYAIAEDLCSRLEASEFANLKRYVLGTNRRRHESGRGYSVRLPSVYEDCDTLYFSRAYSSFGQASLKLQALQDLTPEALDDQLQALVQQAMPIALRTDSGVTSQHFRCLIGSANASAFASGLGQRLRAQLPTCLSVEQQNVMILESDDAERVSCFILVSNFALMALPAQADYQRAYQQSVRPMHRYAAEYTAAHPLESGDGHYQQLADDFLLYLEGIVLGVLERQAEGGYRLATAGSTAVPIDETHLAAFGLQAEARQYLAAAVSRGRDALRHPLQYAALSLVFDYYEYQVYKAPRSPDEFGELKRRPAPASIFARNLRRHYERQWAEPDHAQRKVLIARLQERFEHYSLAIAGSLSDPEPASVASGHQEKRRIDPRLLDPDWLLEQLEPCAATPTASALAVEPTPGQALYHLSVQGCEYGPYSLEQLHQYRLTGQFAEHSLVWRPGLPAWSAASTLAELAGVFQPPPASR